MYSLPSHLSQSSRDLILRLLVVDPIKRITIPGKEHPTIQSLPSKTFEQFEINCTELNGFHLKITLYDMIPYDVI